MAKKNSRRTLWFIPIRIHCSPATRIVEANSPEEAETVLKTDELYFKNFNNLTRDKQDKIYEKNSKSLGMIDMFEMEKEFFEGWGKDADKTHKRMPEEIPKCGLRYYSKRFGGEYSCKGLDPKETSPANRYCIIQGEHFDFDLPPACPFLKQKSIYIQFTE